MIDYEAFTHVAVQGAQSAIARATSCRRIIDGSVTTDKASWSEVADAAISGMNDYLQFHPADASAYFAALPGLQDHFSSARGTLSEVMKSGILAVVFETLRPAIEEVYVGQFANCRLRDARIWADAARGILRMHGDPISKNMLDNIKGLKEEATQGTLSDAIETMAYFADRVEAHASHQLPLERAEYGTVAKRVREMIEFVQVKIDELDSIDNVRKEEARSQAMPF